MTTTTTVAPAIWVGDLAAYNAGILHGEWIRLGAEMTIDELNAKVKAILAEGTRRYCRETLSAEHEEWMISDYEGFGPIRIGEYSSLSSVLSHVRMMADDPARYFAFIDAMGDHYAEQYETYEVYGPFNSTADYAEELLDDLVLGLGADLTEWLTSKGMPEGFASCIRFDAEDYMELLINEAELDPATLDPMTREANQGLMVAFINADLLNRAGLDVRSSIVLYDEHMMFEYAIEALPPKPYMDRLYRETPVRYWSKGI